MKNVTRSERIFIIVSYILLGLLAVVTIVPLLSVLITSFVSASEIARRGQFILWPEVWDTSAYGILFKTDKLYTGYANTLFVVIVGTALSMFLTITLAYPLSKRELRGRNGILGMVFFTMLFNGGLVPTYIMYTQLFHIRDTIWALIVPNLLLSPFNVILVRNYFRTNIPDSSVEAAKLDGASDLQTLTRVVLPISSPILGTIGLLSGLAYWNNWTNGLYYLVKRTDLYSIQNVLTNMLNNIQFLKTSAMDGINLDLSQLPSVGIRMAIAVIALIPVMIAYPLIQKSFVKGIVVGGVKG